MNEDTALPRPRTAGNENTALIKLIAIFFMLVDHVGVVFFNARSGLCCHEPWYDVNVYYTLRGLGRLGMPLFCWGIVVGTEYTGNIWKYLLRIVIVGVISQPCFMIGLNHGWTQLNVFPTLALGVLAIAGIRWKRWGSHIWLPILAVFLSLIIEMDYGWRGVAMILILYACRKNRGALAAGFVAYCLYLGLVYGSYPSLYGVTPAMLRVEWTRVGSSSGTLVLGDLTALFFQVEFQAIYALPLILIPMKKKGRIPKWIGYSVYPLHLLVLGVIRHWGEIVQTVTSWLGTGTTPPV